jgi:hypothetical protein
VKTVHFHFLNYFLLFHCPAAPHIPVRVFVLVLARLFSAQISGHKKKRRGLDGIDICIPVRGQSLDRERAVYAKAQKLSSLQLKEDAQITILHLLQPQDLAKAEEKKKSLFLFDLYSMCLNISNFINY